MKKLWFVLLTAVLCLGLTGVASAQMYVAPGGQGQALIGELYRADNADGAAFVTFFTIANTSLDEWAEIHVRIRSGRYSVEVWDDQFILSPTDKIWFQIEEDEGGPYLIGEQIKTKIYLNPLLLEQINFTEASKEEMTLGYIEVFGISAAKKLEDLHGGPAHGVRNCLMGGVYLGDFTTGEYVGYNMTAIANFRTNPGGPTHRDGRGAGWIDKWTDECYPQWKTVGSNVVTAPDLCTEPYWNSDWVTTHGPTWNDGDDNNESGIPVDPTTAAGGYPFATEAAAAAAVAKANLGPSANWSLDEVEAALWKWDIKSDYFNRVSDSYSQTVSFGVVTFPAKYLHFNYANWNPGIGMWNGDVAAAIRGNAALTTKPASVPIIAGVWDMDENPWGDSPSITPPLPWEVNLIPVGDLSQAYFTLDPWFLAYYASPFDALYSEGWEMGWFMIVFKDLGWYPMPFDDSSETLAMFQRGKSIYPGSNLMMHYETYGECLKSRAFPWQWTDWRAEMINR